MQPLKFWATNRLLCTLWKTVESGKHQTVEQLLQLFKSVNLFDATLLISCPDNGRELDNMLTLAASLGHTEVVRVLLSAGASVRLTSNWDVLNAAIAGNMADCELIRLLIDAGANVNAADPECSGRTPLTIAVRLKNLEITRLLLSRGSHIDGLGCHHYSALCIAASLLWLPGIRLLVEHGANPLLATGPATAECCPLVCLVKELPKYFADAVGDENIACPEELFDYLVGVTIDRCAGDEGQIQTYLNLALSAAVRWSKYDCALRLLRNGANPNSRGRRAGSLDSPAIFTAILGNDERLCQMLIEHGADVNITDPANNLTPLRCAAMLQSLDIVRMLIAASACIETKTGSYHYDAGDIVDTPLGASLGGTQSDTFFTNVGMLLLRCNASIGRVATRLSANDFYLLRLVKTSQVSTVLLALHAGGLTSEHLRSIDASDQQMDVWRQWTCSPLNLKEIARACIRRNMIGVAGRLFPMALKTDLQLPVLLQNYLMLSDVSLDGLNAPEIDIGFLDSLT